MKKLISLLIILFAGFNYLANAQFSTIYDFTGNDAFTGSEPELGQFISDGTYLYGMTYYGGTYNKGCVFKIRISDNSYSIILSFDGITNGWHPEGALISDGTYLYGMTGGNGDNDKGNIFKIQISNNVYTKMLDFDGTNGRYPCSSLIIDGMYLYGITHLGGSNSMGTIFKIQIDNNAFTKIHDFTNNTNGYYPNSSLLSDGTYLYGMTSSGGTYNKGTVFKFKISDNTFTKILDFNGTNGNCPWGSLISDGTYLYGMTPSGGVSNMGTIFKIQISNNAYTKIYDYTDITIGKEPYHSLISDGTYLYGLTNMGGQNNKGTVFKVKISDNTLTKLLDFDGTSKGSYPRGSLFSDGTHLYGSTSHGGTYDLGCIFKIQISNNQYSKLRDLVGAINGSNPNGALISDGTYLYGMTLSGGNKDLGTVFKFNIINNQYTKLLDFDGASNGSNP